MSARERDRLEVLGRVKRGELTLVKASELLGLSYRQAKRVCGRYREGGAAGLMHRLRGRASNRGCDAVLREQVLEAYRLKYGDFGPTLACEYLAREDGLVVGVETLRRWLLGTFLLGRNRGQFYWVATRQGEVVDDLRTAAYSKDRAFRWPFLPAV